MSPRVDKRKCASNPDKCRLPNGNCPYPGADGLPVQCVGPWVRNKHYYLNRYLEATSAVRLKFSKSGNVYIDLFSGPGKCIIAEEYNEINGGGLIALNQTNGNFTEYHYFDIVDENINAIKCRIGKRREFHFYPNDSNVKVASVIQKLLKHNDYYHFTYVDPFGTNNLKFNTIKELAKLKRNDLFITFPIGAMLRNLPMWKLKTDTPLDNFLGTTTWRESIKGVSSNNIYSVIMNCFQNQLVSVGYPKEGLESAIETVSIKNTKEVDLYVLFLASKHPLAQKIWASTKKIGPDSQRKLF